MVSQPTSRSHWELVAVRIPLGPVWGASVDGGVGALAGVGLGFLVELGEGVGVVLMVLLLMRVLQLVLIAQLREGCGGGYCSHQLTTL